MRRIHLIRHAAVSVDLNVPAREWKLAPGADAPLASLAWSLQACGLRRIVASQEPKATATAKILATALGVPVEVRDGLEEHHRLVGQQTPSREAFVANLRRLFAHPADLVFGTESADAALRRFHAAVSAVMAGGNDDEAVVTHGTVMSLLIAAGGNGHTFDVWQRLGLPDLVTLDWPSLRVAGRPAVSA